MVTDEEANDIQDKCLFKLGNGKTIVGTTQQNTTRHANHNGKPSAEARIHGNRAYILAQTHPLPANYAAAVYSPSS